MFETLGRFAYRRRRLVLAAGAASSSPSGVAWGTGVFGSLPAAASRTRTARRARAAQRPRPSSGGDDADVVVLYRAPDRTVDDPAFRQAVTGTLAALPADAWSRRTVSWYDTGAAPLVCADRHATYAVLTLRRRDEQQRSRRVRTDRGPAAPRPGCRRRSAARSTVGGDINEQVSEDIARAETLSMPVAAGAARAGLRQRRRGHPAAGHRRRRHPRRVHRAARCSRCVTEVSVFSVNIVTMLGLGLAIDYAPVHRQPVPRGAAPRAMSTEDAVGRDDGHRRPDGRVLRADRGGRRWPGCCSSRRCSCARWASAGWPRCWSRWSPR